MYCMQRTEVSSDSLQWKIGVCAVEDPKNYLIVQFFPRWFASFV